MVVHTRGRFTGRLQLVPGLQAADQLELPPLRAQFYCRAKSLKSPALGMICSKLSGCAGNLAVYGGSELLSSSASGSRQRLIASSQVPHLVDLALAEHEGGSSVSRLKCARH